MPKLVAVHKGFALPAFDQRAASPRDIGPGRPPVPATSTSSSTTPATTVRDRRRPYPRRRRGELRRPGRGLAGQDPPRERLGRRRGSSPGACTHGNVPNVYAEIGSVWRERHARPRRGRAPAGQADHATSAHARICWGTDSLWFGSPQSEIVAFRAFKMSAEGAGTSTTCPTASTATRGTPAATRSRDRSYMRQAPRT